MEDVKKLWKFLFDFSWGVGGRNTYQYHNLVVIFHTDLKNPSKTKQPHGRAEQPWPRSKKKSAALVFVVMVYDVSLFCGGLRYILVLQSVFKQLLLAVKLFWSQKLQHLCYCQVWPWLYVFHKQASIIYDCTATNVSSSPLNDLTFTCPNRVCKRQVYRNNCSRHTLISM